MVCFQSEILGYLFKYTFFVLFSLSFHILFSHHFIDTYRLLSHDVTAAILVPKTMKRRPCWCPKPILWELNSFLMQTLSFVPINLHGCWPREWKHSIKSITVKPVLSGHLLFPLFTLNETFIKRTPLLSGRGHLKRTWNGHFYCCQPVLNGHL